MEQTTDVALQAHTLAAFRLEQTTLELESLSKLIVEWLARLDKADAAGLHKTQLGAVRSVLAGAAEKLLANVGEVDPAGMTVAEVYDLCRDYDQAAVWLRRLWEFVRGKFDQREEPTAGSEVARLLKSADEVIWSCYHAVLNEASGRSPTVKHGPAPLAYVEPEYTPATVQLDKPLPLALVLKAELTFLDEFMESLPIPVLRLPPWCVGAPWWLVYVAHEVGHHVQHDLNLVAHFREGLRKAARDGGLASDDARLWGDWSEEIFADVFSVMMMGQWAVRAIAEAEMGTPEKMVRHKDNYPAPIIRLALMERLARSLGLPTSGALLGLDPQNVADTDQKTKLDFGVIGRAVEFARAELPGDLGTLESLCGFDKGVFQQDAGIDMLASLIPSGGALADEESRTRIEAARKVAAATLCAWARLAEEKAGEKRDSAREDLSRRSVETLLRSGPRETRGKESPDGEIPGGGQKLAEKLLRAARSGRRN
jgi:hypothetical protein